MDEDGFKLSEARVGIVGLGLMGASLALDLRGLCAELVGVSRSPETLAYALDHHIVDRVTDFDSSLDCDLLVLAAPVRTIIRQLQQMGAASGRAARPTVVLDLGSTKQEIVRAMQTLPVRFDPIGGHPMCGKEVAGIRHAETGLYRDKTFILTPLNRTSKRALALVHEVLAAIGSHPLVLSPERQDQLVAMTSHLPYLVSCALVNAALSREDPQLWAVAASGFRDTSRLAASELTMMMDILLTNRAAVLDALRCYRIELDLLMGAVEAGEEGPLQDALLPAQRQRAQMSQRQ